MATLAPAASRTSVELALQGNRNDVRDRVFSATLLLTLLISLFVLIVLLWTVVAEAWPVLRRPPSEWGADDFGGVTRRHRNVTRGHRPNGAMIGESSR